MLDEFIIVALDVDSVEEAVSLIDKLGEETKFYKINPYLLYPDGAKLIDKLKSAGKRIFLDLKLHDIPSIVYKTVQRYVEVGVDYISINGVFLTIDAAIQGIGDTGTKIINSTILTSAIEQEMNENAYGKSYGELILQRSYITLLHNAHGIYCAGPHLKDIVNGSTRMKKEPILITPSVRISMGQTEDLQRIYTPLRAIQDGATHIVVGRPIFNADDPAVEFDKMKKFASLVNQETTTT